ncbi:MAG TPA: hypothetical protein ENJ07_05030 [Gammaproteobacteria bacterium]|nr:hypothetical protein [Gammaproteobacteria bacterium]
MFFNYKHNPYIVLLSLLFTLPALTGCIGDDEQSPDPVVKDFGIAYIKRAIPKDEDGLFIADDEREILTFREGSDLYLRNRASPSATEKNITTRITNGKGDVKDISASYDGSKLIFSMRLSDQDSDTWNLWEYDIQSDQLSRLINSDNTAELGHDTAPHYLPDGRIVFTSTRQRQTGAMLLDEGKPKFSGLDENRNEPASVLHTINADGSNIRQISFNQSHDLNPSVLNSGEIIFSRWDHMGNKNEINLYKINPDGTNLQLLYGANSHTTGTNETVIQFLRPKPMPDGKLLTTIKPFNDPVGDIVLIDIDNFSDYNQPLPTATSSVTQTAATSQQALTDGTISIGGQFHSAFPLWDGTERILVSWSQCRLLQEDDRPVPCTEKNINNEDVTPAFPLYGIYIYDKNKNIMLPVIPPEEGIITSNAIALQPREIPEAIPDKISGLDLNADFIEQNVGVLHIRSVYDFDGTYNNLGGNAENITELADPLQTRANERPARFLRIIKAVPTPDGVSGSTFGRSNRQKMREILGYSMIEPDGSVMVKVPANIAFTISVLDKNGQRIGDRHENWMQVRPGETLECHGCHDADSTQPHGRPEATTALNNGATTDNIPFPNTRPELIAITGETMAQTRARISCETDCNSLNPSMDIIFNDAWTDPNIRPIDPPFSYRYADLSTPTPTTPQCLDDWDSLCRTIINYIQHIHPIWSAPRTIGTTDNTCSQSQCHAPTDNNANPRVPAAQLDLLTADPSDQNAAHITTYRELFFNDNAQEVIDGVLQDKLIQETDENGQRLFETDENGDFIRDANGDAIPITTTVRAPRPVMSVNGSRSFFERFDAASSTNHSNLLTPAERRLISEWLDIGGQYYNNPFDLPPED